MIYLKWWKGRLYNKEYSTQWSSSPELTEKSKVLDKQKLREFNTTRLALQQMLKELL